MKLGELTLEDAEKIRQMRNAHDQGAFRTPGPISKEHQERWYRRSVQGIDGHSRWWSLLDDGELAGYGGVTWVHPIDRISELSLFPVTREGFELIAREAFEKLEMRTVYVEVFACSPDRTKWERILAGYPIARPAWLPDRKFYNGKHWGSIYMSFPKECLDG